MDTDAVVIGGGVVGLGIFAALATRGRRTVLMERHAVAGMETSSRNSGVVHGGMYYSPGSLKARLCVEGRRFVYALAESAGIRHKRCGKMIVAVTHEEERGLAEILERGRANGAVGLRFLSSREIAELEPHVSAVAALFSPETGVIDAHGLMDAFRAQGEAAGGMAVFGAEVTGLENESGGWSVRYNDSDGSGVLSAQVVVNAAGLQAQQVMRMAGLDCGAMGLALKPCAGRYFSVSGESRKKIRGLIYPSPEANLVGLGIHTITDIGGGVKLGPDTQYVEPADSYDYSVESGLLDKFFASAKRYLPFLSKEDMNPDMAGMRPKLADPGEKERDFHIQRETNAKAPGFFNLAGIESPGLTASPAIGRMIADMVDEFLWQR